MQQARVAGPNWRTYAHARDTQLHPIAARESLAQRCQTGLFSKLCVGHPKTSESCQFRISVLAGHPGSNTSTLVTCYLWAKISSITEWGWDPLLHKGLWMTPDECAWPVPASYLILNKNMNECINSEWISEWVDSLVTPTLRIAHHCRVKGRQLWPGAVHEDL